MATAKKSSIKSKVVSGNSKKSVKKLTPKNAFFSIMGVLALSFLLGLGWMKWQGRQLTANAANSKWTDLSTINEGGMGGGEAPDVKVYACKTDISSNLVRLQVLFVKKAGENKVVVQAWKKKKITDQITNYSTKPSYSNWSKNQIIVKMNSIDKKTYKYVDYRVSGKNGGYLATFAVSKVNTPCAK